jgi:hypothetical protein
VITILALQNPTPETALEAGAREVISLPVTDPVPIAARPDDHGREAVYDPAHSGESPQAPPPSDRPGTTEGVDLTVPAPSRSQEFPK